MLCVVIGSCLYGCAPQETRSGSEESVTAVVPVYRQLVSFRQPANFKGAFANDTGKSFIQEWVPEGETVEKWSQMITLTGMRDLAVFNASPMGLLGQIATKYKQSCPESFSTRALGNTKVKQFDTSGIDGFAAVVACGNNHRPTPQSEVALLIGIRGSLDLYTLQWAERAEKTNGPPVIDEAKWRSRLNSLAPIKLCSRLPGESAPYPSCLKL